MGKLTVHELRASKGKRNWIQPLVGSPTEGAAAVAAGIRVISCEPDHTLEKPSAAAPDVFLTAGMPHGAVATPDEAIRPGFEILRRGADAVYCSHSPRFIEAMAREAIPVTGHVGLVPNKAAWTGFRAIDRTADKALRVLRDVRDLENAGAAFLEVEVVPVELADHITRGTSLITMGMGCGDVCDTEYLFICDVLGSHGRHYPRRSKRYADFSAMEADLQKKRIEVFRAFASDVDRGAYPEDGHPVRVDWSELDAFLADADNI